MNQSEKDVDAPSALNATGPDDQTLDSSAAEHITAIRQKYEAAWRQALGGAPLPRFEEFLNLGSEEVRPALSAELHAVKDSYEPLVENPDSPATAPTLDAPAAPQSETVAKRPKATARVTGYKLLGRLGRGAMGVVYKARHIALKREVALKMVLAGGHASPVQLARFRAEAHAVAHIQHPNIVQIYEVGEEAGLPYFALEYVGGGTLDKKTGRQPQPPREAARLVETLAHAMECAHKGGVVHRDLKPSNILLTPNGVPKIADFGLALRLEEDSKQTRTGTILGTPSYMAPEQARGDRAAIGPGVDVYSLGAILYELLTGSAPFVSPTPTETLRQVLTRDPVPPSRLVPGTPRDVETICLKCLQKEPEKRYLSAAELADDLHRYLSDKPIQARPVGRAERTWRWCRRNPMVAGLTAALAVALLVGTAASTILAVKATRSASQASAEAQRADHEARTATERAEAAALAQKAAERARQTAREQARVADEQRKLALSTLSTLVFRVQEQLHDTPDTQVLKQSLLETALKGLQAVAKESNESTIVDMNMAEAHHQMGDLFQVLGRTPEALDQYKKMLAMTTTIVAEDRDQVRSARNQSVALALVGDTTLLIGDAAKARGYYLEALDLRKKVVRTEPTNPEREVDLAQILTRLGIASPPNEARAYHEEALAIREGLSARAEESKLSDRKRDVWNSRFQLLDLALRTGDLPSARKHGTECAKIAVDLVKRTKTRAAQLDLASTYGKLGLVARREGKPAEANRLLTAAYQNIKPFAEKDPQNLKLQDDYALALAHAGRHAEAAERAAWLRGRVGKNARYLYNIACTYALAAGSSGAAPMALAGAAGASVRPSRPGDSADLAIAVLREAIANGYRDPEEVATDPDLDPVRGHPAFAGVAAGIKAGARK